jgi:hypothetical protein
LKNIIRHCLMAHVEEACNQQRATCILNKNILSYVGRKQKLKVEASPWCASQHHKLRIISHMVAHMQPLVTTL